MSFNPPLSGGEPRQQPNAEVIDISPFQSAALGMRATTPRTRRRSQRADVVSIRGSREESRDRLT